MTVISLAAERAKRRAVRITNIATGITLTLDAALLRGPITAQVAAALEWLSDDELEAFFRARAQAQLQGALKPDSA